MMERLEGDSHVRKWVKRHGVIIPWIDGQRRQRRYVPDFLVEYQDGQKAVIEVKDPGRINSKMTSFAKAKRRRCGANSEG